MVNYFVLLLLVSFIIIYVKSNSISMDANSYDNMTPQEISEEIKNINKTLLSNPFNFRLFFFRGNNYYRLTKFKKALRDYNIAIVLGGLNEYVCVNKANCYRFLNNPHKALKSIKKALQFNSESPEIFVQAGIIALMAKKPELAREFHEKALKLNSRNSESILAMAGFLFNTKKYNEAVMYSDDSINIKPSEPSLFLNALIHFELFEYEQSIESLNKVLSLNENNTAAYVKRGYAKLNLGKFEEALDDFNKSMKISKNYFEMGYGRALCYESLEKHDEAINELDRVYRSTKNTECLHHKGRILNKIGKHEEAVKALDKIIEWTDENAGSLFYRGLAKNNLKKYNEALEDFTLSLKKMPDNEEALHQMGVSYYYLEDYENSVKCYTKALNLAPKSTHLYYNRGLSYRNLGDLKNAEDDFKKSIELFPLYTDSYLQLGIIMHERSLYEKALTYLNYYIKLSPEDFWGHYYKGLACRSLKKTAQAIRAFDKSILYEKNYPNAYFQRASCWLDIGKYDHALVWYKKIIEIDDSYAPAYNAIGYTLNEEKKYEEAIVFFDKAIEKSPNFFWAYENKSDSLFALKRYDEMKPLLYHCISLYADYAPVYYKLGMCYDYEKNYFDAWTAFDRACQLNSKYAESYYEMGNVLMKIGRETKALFAYQQAILANNNYSEAYIARGLAHLNMKEYKEALNDFTHALKLSSHDDDKIHIYTQTAKIYNALENYKSAITSADMALQIEGASERCEAIFEKGFALLHSGNYTEAIKVFEINITNERLLYKSLVEKANCLFHLQKYENALALCNEAIAQNPSEAEGYYLRGILYETTKQYKKALEDYKAAARISKNNAAAKSHISLLLFLDKTSEAAFYLNTYIKNGNISYSQMHKIEELNKISPLKIGLIKGIYSIKKYLKGA